MKNITLNYLNLHEFKGVKDFSIEPNGNNIEIQGQNASGKTTVFDAFTWLLFGKNSEDSQFNPKTLDEDGNELLGHEPLVEATLVVDGKELKLRRELKEHWVKQRGQIEQERKSDTTETYVDDVPKKVSDYKTFINELVDEDTFKILTNPFAFNNMKWDKQREVLMSLGSEITDEDVIASFDDGESLKAVLEDHSISEQTEIVKSQMSKVKKDIDGLPARIDEANRAIADTSNLDHADLIKQQAAKQVELENAQEALSLFKADSSVAPKQEKMNLQVELSDKRASFMQGIQLAQSGLTSDLNEQQQKVNQLNNEKHQLAQSVNELAVQVNTWKTTKQTLLDQFHAEDESTFDEHQLTCPTCGQDYPQEKQAELRDNFNQHRADKLEEIKKSGKAAAAKIAEFEKELQDNQQAAAEKASQVEVETEKLSALTKELETQKQSTPVFEDTTDYKKITEKIAKCDEDIANNNASSDESNMRAQQTISTFKQELQEINEKLTLFTLSDQQTKRIAELQAEDGRLKQLYLDLEKQSYMIEEFTRAKVGMLETEINKRFKLVSFKLFELQKNGGIKETCEATVDGVPFGKGLNNAAKINAGLDIINTLSNAFGIVAPIFVDNAESVNELIDTAAQKIQLTVSTDKKMKVVA